MKEMTSNSKCNLGNAPFNMFPKRMGGCPGILLSSFSAHSEKRKIDLAWAAGMVDGEGSITVVRQAYQPDKNGNKRNPTLRLKLVIVQNDWATLDRLQRIIGGQSHLNDLPWNESQNRRCYQLQFDGVHALKAINKLAPYLYRKKQHMWAANQFWKEGQMGARPGRRGLSPAIISIREKWVSRLRKLN